MQSGCSLGPRLSREKVPSLGCCPFGPGTGPAQSPSYLWFPESSLFSYLRAFVRPPAAPSPSFITALIRLVFKCLCACFFHWLVNYTLCLGSDLPNHSQSTWLETWCLVSDSCVMWLSHVPSVAHDFPQVVLLAI